MKKLLYALCLNMVILTAQQAQELQQFEGVKTVHLLNRVPALAQVTILKSYPSIQLLELYDALLDIKREIPTHIARENRAFKEAFIDQEGEFKGDAILSSIQTAAGYKVSRILGCTLKEMNNGTCQPLKDSNDPSLTVEEKAAMPFKEITEPWAKDWVHLLPCIELFKNQYNDSQWKVRFLIAMDEVNNHPEHFITDDRQNIPFPFNLFKREVIITIDADTLLKKTYLTSWPESIVNYLAKKVVSLKKYPTIIITNHNWDFLSGYNKNFLSEYTRSKQTFFNKIQPLNFIVIDKIREISLKR